MTRKTSLYARKRNLSRIIPKGSRMTVDALKGNGLDTYKLHSTLFSESEIDQLMAEARQALIAARRGQASYNDYASFSTAMQKGQAIEDARTIIRGFEPIYKAAEVALTSMEARATATGKWVPPTLYASEINALDDLVWAYEQALKICTYREFYDCQEVALARARSRGEKVYQTGDILEYPET